MSNFWNVAQSKATHIATEAMGNHGRELRAGDTVVGPEDDVPDARHVVDVVEVELEKRGLEFTEGQKRAGVEYVRDVREFSNSELHLDGDAKSTGRSDLGEPIRRAGEYAMSCHVRIRDEKVTGTAETQSTWNTGTDVGTSSSQSRTQGRSVELETPIGVTLGGSGESSSSRSETRSAHSGSGTQAATFGERREGELFLHCKGDMDIVERVGTGMPQEKSGQFEFDVRLGTHATVRQTR